jgi:hypothetical protein
MEEEKTGHVKNLVIGNKRSIKWLHCPVISGSPGLGAQSSDSGCDAGRSLKPPLFCVGSLQFQGKIAVLFLLFCIFRVLLSRHK